MVVATSISRLNCNKHLTYEQTLDYIYQKLPMYQRIGASAFKKDLTNIRKLCDVLGNPQNTFKSIHVAGTNGKGSTSHILSAIYQNNGYNVGLYTSPHLVDFRERIKYNGQLCTETFVIDFVEVIKEHIEEINPSFFEITVAMAFQYFAQQGVDIAIIETGLGGRLDSTNIITPLASIITSIGMDHKEMLGDTLEKIAVEKAGIIKERVPVILGHIPDSPKAVIYEIAQQKSAPISEFINTQFITDLQGEHQHWNIGTALQCSELLLDVFPITDIATNEALLNVSGIAGLEGRWQTLHSEPLVVCDVGHNEEGFGLISKQINALHLKPIYLLGFVKEKDVTSIAPLLPAGTEYHFVKPQIPRGMEATEAKRLFGEATGVNGTAHDTITSALHSAYASLKIEKQNLCLFIGGSNFVVADLLQLHKTNQAPWTK